MIHVGIDPGTSGGVAALDDAGALLGVWDMPTAELGAKTDKGHKRVVDAAALARILGSVGSPVCITLEAVYARSGEGVTSSFTFGGAFHAARSVAEVVAFLCPGVVLTHAEPRTATGRSAVNLVQPAAWRKSAGLPAGAGKPEYHDEAVKRWPDAPLWGPRKGKLLDRAAALLIADHGRQQHLANLRFAGMPRAA